MGDPSTVESATRELWRHGMHMIAVTYCQTPEVQKQVYDNIRLICQ